MTPELEKHLSGMQDCACRVRDLLWVMEQCINDPKRHQMAFFAIVGAQEIVKELNAGLDSLTLGKFAPLDGAERG